MNPPRLLSAVRRAAKASSALLRRDRPKSASASAAERPAADTGDRRLLDAILQLNSARGEAETVRALAVALVSATGYDAAAVMQARPAEDARTVVAAHLSGEDGSHSALIGLSGDSPAMTRAIEQGAAIVISGPQANRGALAAPDDALPSWAVKRGYTSGIAAPVTRGPETLAAVYVLRRQSLPVLIEDIQRVEVLLNLASRHFPAVAPAPIARPVGRAVSHYSPLADMLATAAARDTPLSTPPPLPVGGVVLSVSKEPDVARSQPKGWGSIVPTLTAPESQPAGHTPVRETPPPASGGGSGWGSFDRKGATPWSQPDGAATPSAASIPFTAGPGRASTRSPELAPVPTHPPTESQRLPITTSGLTLDPARERVEVRGIRLALSSTEFALLYAMAAASRPLGRAELASRAWDEGEAPSFNAVEVALCRLRNRLSRVPGGAGVIETVRGQGYRLCAPGSDAPEGLSLTSAGQDA